MQKVTLRLIILGLIGSGLAASTPAQAQAGQPGNALAIVSVNKVRNLSPNPPAPTEAVLFYDDSHKDLDLSLAWMEQTNATAPTFWNVYTEAKIRLKMKDYAGARATAERSKQLALAATPANLAYVKLNEDLLAEAGRPAAK